MIVFTAPEQVSATSLNPRIFLAGSIEQGKASDWQKIVLDGLEKNWESPELVVLNPRRKVWDPTLEQSASNSIFNEQVTWELDQIEDADCVIMNLEPGTMSPISLLELGILAGQNSMGILNKTIVRCPQGFWRKGNVDITCSRFYIPVVETIDELILGSISILSRNYERRLTSKW